MRLFHLLCLSKIHSLFPTHSSPLLPTGGKDLGTQGNSSRLYAAGMTLLPIGFGGQLKDLSLGFRSAKEARHSLPMMLKTG
jgi:hypothetical protein